MAAGCGYWVSLMGPKKARLWFLSDRSWSELICSVQGAIFITYLIHVQFYFVTYYYYF